MGRDVEEDLGFCIVIAEDGEGGIVGGAGLGGDALGHLLLDHDGDGVEALALQQGRQVIEKSDTT